jgi:hypothetical protein
MPELGPSHILIILFFASMVLQFLDVTAGTGYGTLMTPLFLLLGVPLLQAVPTILLVNTVAGITAASTLREFEVVDLFKVENRRILLLLTGTGVIGTAAAVLVSVNLPEFWVSLYVAFLLMAIGVYLLHVTETKFWEKIGGRVWQKLQPNAFWKKLSFIGLLGGFNKSISAGGYGALLTAGQIVAGLAPKRAVSITVLTEGVLSLSAVVAYLTFQPEMSFNFDYFIAMLAGSLLAIPIAAFSLKRIEGDNLGKIVAFSCLLLGVVLLFKVLI